MLVMCAVIVGLRTLTYKPEMVQSSYLMGNLKLVTSSTFDLSKFFSLSAISSICCKKLMNSKGLQEEPTPTSVGEINKREIPVTRSASMVVSSMRTDDFSDAM